MRSTRALEALSIRTTVRGPAPLDIGEARTGPLVWHVTLVRVPLASIVAHALLRAMDLVFLARSNHPTRSSLRVAAHTT